MNKTDIINAGLFVIGAKKIFAPSDNTKAARLASSIYEYTRKLVFDLPINWHWATARSASLSQLTDPATGFDHQYALPDNTVRVLALIDEDGDNVEYAWETGVFIEAGDTTTITKTLQTNVDAGDAFIKYIVLIEDEAMYPAWFAQLISLNIALYLSEPIKQYTPHYTKVSKMLEAAMTVASEANALWNTKINTNNNRPTDEGNTDLVDAAGIQADTDIVKVLINNS